MPTRPVVRLETVTTRYPNIWEFPFWDFWNMIGIFLNLITLVAVVFIGFAPFHWRSAVRYTKTFLHFEIWNQHSHHKSEQISHSSHFSPHFLNLQLISSYPTFSHSSENSPNLHWENNFNILHKYLKFTKIPLLGNWLLTQWGTEHVWNESWTISAQIPMGINLIMQLGKKNRAITH